MLIQKEPLAILLYILVSVDFITNSPIITIQYIAAKKEHTDICKLLVDKGSDVNTSDNNGNTPLHIGGFKFKN